MRWSKRNCGRSSIFFDVREAVFYYGKVPANGINKVSGFFFPCLSISDFPLYYQVFSFFIGFIDCLSRRIVIYLSCSQVMWRRNLLLQESVEWTFPFPLSIWASICSFYIIAHFTYCRPLANGKHLLCSESILQVFHNRRATYLVDVHP